MTKFDELPEAEQNKYCDFAAAILNDLWVCASTQQSWWYGAPNQKEYLQADEDEELVYETAKMIFDFTESERG